MKRKIFTQLEAYESDEEPKRVRQASAVPLIYVQGDRFALGSEAVEFLQQLSGPIAVIAVAGKYRTGKSFFLNRVLLEKKACFGVGGTVNACTKGIWLWTEPIEMEGKTVIVLDTEGLGAFNATDTHDSRIFALALLLSTYFVYNSVGTIDESAINSLSLVANLSKHVCIQSQGSESPEQLGEYFPEFLWLVRDFTLQLVDPLGKPISSQQYLEAALADQEDPEKNRVRALLRSYFPRRSCETLVRPCLEESQLQRLDQLSDRDLRPEFLRQSKQLRRKILERAAPKRALGKPLDGPLLAELCRSFVGAINSGAAPAIRDSWTMLAELQSVKAIQEALGFFKDSLPQLPQDPDLLENNLERLYERAYSYYREHCFECNDKALAELGSELRLLGKRLQDDNLAYAERRIFALIGSLDSAQCNSPKELELAFRELQATVQAELGASRAIQSLWATLALQPSWSWFQRLTLETALRLEQAQQQQQQWCKKQEEFQQVIADYEQRLSQAAQASSAAQLAVEQAKADGFAAVEQLHSQHQQELELYKGLVSEAEQRLESLQQLQTSELGEQDLLQIKLSAQSLELADLVASEAELKNQLRDQQLRLEALLTVEQERETLEQRLSQAQTLYRQLEYELSTLKQNSAEQESQFQSALDKLFKENSATLSEIRRQSEQEKSQLQRRVKEAESQIQKLSQEHSTTVQDSQKLVQKLSKTLEQSESKASGLRKELDERFIQVQRGEAALVAARERFAAELKETHEKYRQDGQRALDERTKLMQQLRELSTASAVKDVRIETLSARLAQLQESAEQERKRFESAQTNLHGAWQTAELKRAETLNFELKQSLVESQSRISGLEKQLKDQEREFAVYRVQRQMEYEVQKSKSGL